MVEFISKCPHCQSDLLLQDDWIGMVVECPICSKSFSVRKNIVTQPKKCVEQSSYNNKSINKSFVSFCIVASFIGLLIGIYVILFSISIFEAEGFKAEDKKITQKIVQEKEKTIKTEQKKEYLELKFLGISVNDTEENIKTHLLSRGFKGFNGGNGANGRFWLLKEPSIANVAISSGKIIIYFQLDPTTEEQAGKNVGHLDRGLRDEAANSLNKLRKLESVVIRKYFDALQMKYCKSQVKDKNIIILNDGLIEFFPHYTYAGLIFPSYVVFYNRKAAAERLQEINAKNNESHRQFNDI